MTEESRKVSRRGSGGKRASPRLFATKRLEAFSHGGLAIVVTLLVLELEIPGADANLSHELAGQPIARRVVGRRVRAHAVGERLDEGRALALAGGRERGPGHGQHGEDVVAVDADAGEAE